MKPPRWLAAVGILPGGLVLLAVGGGAAWWWSRRKAVAMLRDQLTAIMPHADPDDVADFAGAIYEAMKKYGIDSPERKSAFLAQIAHESDSLWHNRDRYGTARGEEYASGAAYEGRADLGNTESGDGATYKGRGLIQVTGRANYQAASDALGYDFVSDPAALCEPKWSALSAGQFWHDHGLNELADAGNFTAISNIINRGDASKPANGAAQRLAFLTAAESALGMSA